MGLISATWSSRWPNGKIPYEFDPSISGVAAAKAEADAAIAEWNTNTALKLMPRAGESDFVLLIDRPQICMSPVGRQRGRQIIGCPLIVGTANLKLAILHEIGHAAGLFHEHQRRDRDDNVQVLPAVLVPGGLDEPNFKIKGDLEGSHVNGYDCNSIMHYPVTAGKIILKTGGCATIGPSTGLSPNDINTADFYRWESFNISSKAMPAAESWGSGRLDLFAVGAGDKIYHKWYDGAWNPSPQEADNWEKFEISAKYGPAVTSWGSGRLDLFAVGSDDKIYHKWYDGKWYPSPKETSTWEKFEIKAKYSPAVVSWGTGRLDLFAVGSDDKINHKWYDGSWHPSAPDIDTWEKFEITAKYGPAVTSWGAGRLDLFVVGSDDKIHHKWYDGSWHPAPPDIDAWEKFEISAKYSPAATSWGSGRLDLFAVGSDDKVYHKWFDGSWNPAPPSVDSWVPFPAKAQDGPAAATWGSQRLDVFVRGQFNDLYHMWFDYGWNSV